jgi:hypothetical protein
MKMSESTEEATTEEQEPTIGKELFPEQFTDDTAEAEEKAEPIETEPETKEPVEEIKAEEPIYLNIEEDGDKLIKLKINGEETTIAVKDVVRRVQTDKYLTQEGQKLAEERKQLNTLKSSVADKSVEPKLKESWEDGYEEEQTVNPRVEELESKIDVLTQALGSVQQNIAPTVHEQDMHSVDRYLRDESGEFDDFMDYRQEIENHFATFSIEDQGKIGLVDYVNQYKNRKIAKMVSESRKQSVEPAENRPAIVNVIGGSSTPSGADEDDLKHSKAMKRAYETGDFSEVYALRGIV